MITCENLTIHYGKAASLWDISFQIPPGTVVGILGPNGAGKSTLLKAILGMVKPFSGKISSSGKIAYIPQRESIDWDFPITALEVVLMGRYGKLGVFGRLRKADRESARAMLDLVGMSAFADRQIGQLSGGQQQRLFIARALLQDADLLLLDEPFAGVDFGTEKALMEILKKQAQGGKTVLIVHHDLPTVKEYFDWAVLLNTRLIACGPVSEVFGKEQLRSTFRGQALFDEAMALSVEKRGGR